LCELSPVCNIRILGNSTVNVCGIVVIAVIGNADLFFVKVKGILGVEVKLILNDLALIWLHSEIDLLLLEVRVSGCKENLWW
jgi:hypothetical protein